MSLLERIDENIWLVEGENVNFYSFPYPTRSVVVKLQSDCLWVWSPIQLTKQLESELNDLGEVRYLVSPNKLHHLYLKEWKEHYPNAKLCAPLSVSKKRSDLQFDHILEENALDDWKEDLIQFWFTGSLFMDEMIYLHRSSKTVIIADMSENFTDRFLDRFWGWRKYFAKAWKIVDPYGKAPLEYRLSWIVKRKDRAKMQRLIDLGPTKVIMAHGKWIQCNGKEFLESSFSWLL